MSVRVVADAPPPRRRRLTAAPLVALAVAFAGGWLLGQLTASKGADRQGGARGAVARDAGPSRLVTGIPLGFPRSRAGAVAALTAYSAVLSDPNTLLDRSRREQVLGLVATPSYTARFGGAAATQLDNAARAFPPVYFAAPIAYRVAAYDGETATVLGWGVSVAGGSGSPPQATWGTSRATAVWSRGDWRIDAAETVPGPTPALAPGQRPSSGAAFVNALAASRGLHHAP